MSNGRILTEEQLEEMVAMRERGRGVAFIAQYFTDRGTPISGSAINWQCLRLGADAPPRLRGKIQQRSAPVRRGNHIVRPFTPEEDAEILRLEGQGMKIQHIANAIGRQNNSLRGRLYTLARRDARKETA